MTDEAKTPTTKESRKSPNRIKSFRKQLRQYLEDHALTGDDKIEDLLEAVDEDFYEYAETL
jgi:hypothetical protein